MSEIIRSECSKVALPDPPEVVNANPIHDEKAGGYGYAGPIVAGIHTYGWMVPAILDAAGDSWLSHGWADIKFPRPVFAGDELHTEVIPDPSDSSVGIITQRAGSDNRITIEGTIGLGDGPWRPDFVLPTSRNPVAPATKPTFTGPDQIPTDTDYPAMSVPIGLKEHNEWMTSRIVDDDFRWQSDDPSVAPLVHPSWAPGQMTPLIRHSYRFPAGIHASGTIQHLSAHRAGGSVTVAGRWRGVELRKGKHWSTTDAVFIDDRGLELSHIRQVVVILDPLPRS